MKPQESGVRNQESDIGVQECSRRPLTPDSCSLTPALHDPRVARALEEYLAALETGTAPVRDQFLANHGEIAGVLAECLEGLEFIRGAAVQAREPVVPPAA